MNTHSECMIYPGEFIPRATKNEVLSALKDLAIAEAGIIPADVIDEGSSYLIEIVIPGVEKENFLIYTDENILTVCVYNKDNIHMKNESLRKHVLSYNTLERHIILPADADTSFVIAEYNTGILRIFITKTEHPSPSFHTRIAVY